MIPVSYTVFVHESKFGRIELADEKELADYNEDPTLFNDRIKWTQCMMTEEMIFDNTNQEEVPHG